MGNSLLIGSDNRITSRTSCIDVWLAHAEIKVAEMPYMSLLRIQESL